MHHATLALASGTLLGAAALTLLLAHHERRTWLQSRPDGPPAQGAEAGRSPSPRDTVGAAPAPALADPGLDAEHHKLAAGAAALRAALLRGDVGGLDSRVQELIDARAFHVEAEIDVLERMGLARSADDVAADRCHVADAGHALRTYRHGDLALADLVEHVTGPMGAGHLARFPPASIG